jgi:hypothetical protein
MAQNIKQKIKAQGYIHAKVLLPVTKYDDGTANGVAANSVNVI